MKAYFIGYQEGAEEGQYIALYDISGGERSGSSVSAASLKAEGIEVPPTPNINEWKNCREKMKEVPDHELNSKFMQAELEKNLTELESAIAEIRSRRTIPYSRARMRLSQEKVYQYLRASK